MTTTIQTAPAAATTQIYQVYIKASAQAIWDAITKPEWTARYGYGPRAEYDLRPGGSYKAYSTDDHRRFHESRGRSTPEVMVDGEVIESDPPHRLVQTWRMCMDEAIAAEGFTRLTHEIADIGGGVSKLVVIHELEGAPMLALLVSGGMEKTGAGGGWNWVLSGLKTLLETGESLRV